MSRPVGTIADVRQRSHRRREVRLHLAGQKVDHHRASAAIRHVLHRGAGHRLEQFGGEISSAMVFTDNDGLTSSTFSACEMPATGAHKRGRSHTGCGQPKECAARRHGCSARSLMEQPTTAVIAPANA
jgi:hypothetical protein